MIHVFEQLPFYMASVKSRSTNALNTNALSTRELGVIVKIGADPPAHRTSPSEHLPKASLD